MNAQDGMEGLWIVWLLLIVVAPLAGGYLLGSIPFGLLFTRLAGLGDVRSIGSGNIGATNVLRTGHKGVAAATLLGDALKGTVAVLLFASFGSIAPLVAGLGAFLGHLFPVWLRFKGGKGIATYVGVTLGLSLWGLLAFAVTWLAIAFATRYSSLAALVATVVVPAAVWFSGYAEGAVALAVMTVISWIMHRENIRRLLAGTESKIGAKG